MNPSRYHSSEYSMSSRLGLLNAQKMIWMNFVQSSHAPAVKRLVETVYEELRGAGALKTRRAEDRCKQHLEALLLNLHAVHISRRRYVAIGMRNNDYRGADRVP